MENPYKSPNAALGATNEENNSGGGKSVVPPPGISGWSWGAFLLNWIWAIFNQTWIGLVCLIPYVGLIGAIYLGIKGRELAWQNKRWDSIEHFQRVQKAWSWWGVVLTLGLAGLGIVLAIAIPMMVAGSGN